MTIPKRCGVFVDFLMLQTQDLFDGLNLGVLGQVLAAGFADIKEFTAKREDAVVVASDNADARDG